MSSRVSPSTLRTCPIGSRTSSRPIGHVDNPVTLTTDDPDDPVTIAEYDLPYRG
jgi:hypothetical protein